MTPSPRPHGRAGTNRILQLHYDMRDVVHDCGCPPLHGVPWPIGWIGPAVDTVIALGERRTVVVCSGYQKSTVTVHLLVAQPRAAVRLSTAENENRVVSCVAETNASRNPW